MEYNTTHEQIIGGQKITTYISMTVTPAEKAPSPDETIEMADVNYATDIIKQEIARRHPGLDPSDYEMMFELALSNYADSTGTPEEKAKNAVKNAYYRIAYSQPNPPVDNRYREALIKAALYNHYPPIVTPSEFKRVFARALSEYEAFKGTPAEKAAAAVKFAIWVIPRDETKYDNALIKAEIAKHSPTIAKGAEFKEVYDKALIIFNQLALWDKPSPEKAGYAVKGAIAIVCPDKCQPTPAELISDVIAERWPAHLGLISTTNELKIVYRARAIFNEFAGCGHDKAVKAVEHAFRELVDKVGEELVTDLEARQLEDLIGAAIRNHPRRNNVGHPYS